MLPALSMLPPSILLGENPFVIVQIGPALKWVVHDVANLLIEFFLIPNDPVEAFAIPDFSNSAVLFLKLVGGKRFPRVGYGAEVMVVHNFHDDVNVIIHDDVRPEAIALSLKMLEDGNYSGTFFRVKRGLSNVQSPGYEVNGTHLTPMWQ